jgi:hypothetical protein
VNRVLTISAIIILASLLPKFADGQNRTKMKNQFLGLDYTDNIHVLFDAVERNAEFQLETSRQYFMQSAEFKARYLKASKLYPNADSIILHVLTCNDMGTFSKPGANNCKAIKVLYYLKDTNEIKTNYRRLDSLIKSGIKSSNPEWVNKEGTSDGVYFCGNGIYPFIELDMHSDKYIYLTVEYLNYDRGNAIDSSSLKELNGTYQRELWDYIAPLTGRGPRRDSTYHVKLSVLSSNLIHAELVRNDSVFSTRKIAGHIKDGKFMVRRKFTLIPIPFFFFYYYNGKMEWALTPQREILADIKESIFIEVIMAEGIRKKEQKTFKKVR